MVKINWKIKVVLRNPDCPYKQGRLCKSSKRLYQKNPTISVECEKEKCPYKIESDKNNKGK